VKVFNCTYRYRCGKDSLEGAAMPKRFGLIGAVLLGGGLFGAFSEDASHKACSSGLGQFGQALSESAARHCGVDNTIFYIAILATILGVALMAVAILVRS